VRDKRGSLVKRQGVECRHILYAGLARISSGGSTESPSSSIELALLYLYPPHLCSCSDKELLYLRAVPVWLFLRHPLSPLVQNVDASQCDLCERPALARMLVPGWACRCAVLEHTGLICPYQNSVEMIAAAIKVPCDTIRCGMVARGIIAGSKFQRIHSHEAGVKTGVLCVH